MLTVEDCKVPNDVEAQKLCCNLLSGEVINSNATTIRERDTSLTSLGLEK